MDTITTTLKREPFADIVDGSKRIEYREIKPYWTARLSKVSTPFRLVLRNGMIHPVPVLTVRIDRISKDDGHYELHIGSVLKVEHWDRKTKRPK
jgi:hypothetical protein